MSEDAPLRLEWEEVLRRLAPAGVTVVETKSGRVYLRRQVGIHTYWHHLPPDLSIPAGPYMLQSLCHALCLDPIIFEDPDR
jgi:hypothetical protein